MESIKLPVGNEVVKDTDTPAEDVKTIEIEGASYNLDKDGNALNPDGSLFKSKEDLNKKPDDDNNDSSLTDQDIEIDGVVYKLNEKGDAVTDDGTVFMEKSKIDELANSGAGGETSLTEIVKLVNITPVDDKGTPIVYENTVDGVASYIKDVAYINKQQGIEEAEQILFAQHPDLYQAYLHKLSTGTLEGFNQQVDWSTVKVEEADDEALISMIVANEMRSGKSKEQSEYLAKLIKADGKLKETGTIAQQELIKAKSDYEKEALAIKQQAEQEELANINAYWNAVEASVKAGKLKIGDTTYKLPQVYRIKSADGKVTTANNDDFLAYMTVPKEFVINNQRYQVTQNEYDKWVEGQSKTHEDDIFDALKRFTKGDTSQFIQEQIKRENAKRLQLYTGEGSKRGAAVGKPNEQNLKLPVK